MIRNWGTGFPCKEPDCGREAVRRGLCRPHYDAIPHPLAPGQPCDVCGQPKARAYALKQGARARGGIRLCDDCWHRVARNRRTPQLAAHSTFRGLHWAAPR